MTFGHAAVGSRRDYPPLAGGGEGRYIAEQQRRQALFMSQRLGFQISRVQAAEFRVPEHGGLGRSQGEAIVRGAPSTPMQEDKRRPGPAAWWTRISRARASRQQARDGANRSWLHRVLVRELEPSRERSEVRLSMEKQRSECPRRRHTAGSSSGSAVVVVGGQGESPRWPHSHTRPPTRRRRTAAATAEDVTATAARCTTSPDSAVGSGSALAVGTLAWARVICPLDASDSSAEPIALWEEV